MFLKYRSHPKPQLGFVVACPTSRDRFFSASCVGRRLAALAQSSSHVYLRHIKNHIETLTLLFRNYSGKLACFYGLYMSQSTRSWIYLAGLPHKDVDE